MNIGLWYLRDASMWTRPDTRRPKKYHLADSALVAACGTMAMLHEITATPNPPESLRCKRCMRIAERRKDAVR